MKAEITRTEGRWLVNVKRVPDLNHDELNFLQDFFRESKVELLEHNN